MADTSMQTALLYDWGPAAHVALVGLVLAAAPLLWLWARHRGASLQFRLAALCALTLFLTFDLVMFGAFTRLTDSGLGCPDWPGCYGNASPLGARHDIEAAQQAMPGGPVTHAKAWVEMVHRYLATGVGVLIVALTALSWWARWRERRGPVAVAAVAGGFVSPWWATVTLLWVCLQGAFGAWTVTMKLYPAIVTAHLLGGMVLLMLLAGQAAAYRPRPLPSPTWAGPAGLLLLALVLVQVTLGGWVSTNYAVLACSEFPSCQGSFWPPMDLPAGFTVLRPLGRTASGGYLSFEALTGIHYMHRLMAYAVLLCSVAFAVALWRTRAPLLRRWSVGILAVAAWQLASGVSNVVLGWPIAAAVGHTGGAGAWLAMLTVFAMRVRQGRQPRTAASVESARSRSAVHV